MKLLIIAIVCLIGFSEAKDQKTRCTCATLEPHTVTCGGYVRIIFRLVTPNDTVNRTKTVLMEPAYNGNVNTYTILGDDSLACVQFAAGLDVWIDNPRGNDFSQKHTSLANNTKAFWDFSWHEIGTTDLPCTIDFILNIAGAQELNYIGFSQGGTVLFVMLDQHPEYEAKLETIQLIAPVVFLKNLDTFLKSESTLIAAQNDLGLYDLFGIYKFPSLPASLGTQLQCLPKVINTDVCSVGTLAYYQMTTEYLNLDFLQDSVDFMLTESPLKSLVHFTQLINSPDKFSQFDYKLGNKARYNNLSPPDYKLTNVSKTIYIYSSSDDTVVTTVGIAELSKRLKSSVVFQLSGYGHSDYYAMTKAKEEIYVPMTQRIMSN